ncbi:unnamed protein product [Mytilus edulis]|uniref:Uncharacterized protein n=1 Tax=Mytilus edulis TaxID=6550 RepID=A0A8S3TLS4_MYTED|nr:unnamed protein product [Mytilus edulis]
MAVNEVKCLLEFKEKAYTVPPFLAGRVIGKHGHEIMEVKDKSIVKNITTDNEKENAGINTSIRRCNEFKADKTKFSSTDGEENCFKERFNEDRRQKQDKKGSRSKTSDEDCFVFFVKNKMLRRLDYVKKQNQNKCALQKLSRCNVKIQHQDPKKLSKRELAIAFGDIVYSVPSFTKNKQFKCQQKCSLKKKVKAKVKSDVIETDHGPTNLTKARFHDNCLGKYIEAAIKNKGLNETLKVASWIDCDEDKGTRIELKSPEFLNDKGEISPQKCRKNKSNKMDKQKFLAPKQKKQKQKLTKTRLKLIIEKQNAKMKEFVVNILRQQ